VEKIAISCYLTIWLFSQKVSGNPDVDGESETSQVFRFQVLPLFCFEFNQISKKWRWSINVKFFSVWIRSINTRLLSDHHRLLQKLLRPFGRHTADLLSIDGWVQAEVFTRRAAFFIVWASSFNPLPGRTRSRGRCSAAIRFVSSSRTVIPCTLWGGRWIGQWRTTWSTVCSSAPHSQAAEGTIPHLCKQERKRPT